MMSKQSYLYRFSLLSIVLGLAILMLPAVTAAPAAAAPAVADAATGQKDKTPKVAVTESEVVVELDRWYRVFIAKNPAGSMHITVKRDLIKKLITTQTAVKITIKRGPQAITIEMGSLFVETDDGKPVRAVGTQKLGLSAVVQTMIFGDDGIELLSEQNGQKQSSKIAPLAGPWMPPAAAGRYMQQQIRKGAKEFSYRTVDPSTGAKVIESKVTVNGRMNIEVMGKTVPAIELLESQSILPGQIIRSYVDEQAVPLRMTLPMMPGGKACRPMPITHCKKHGSPNRCRNAVIASLVRSCRQLSYWRKIKIRHVTKSWSI